MQYDEDYITGPDGQPLYYRAWRCRHPRASLLYVHGMAEHSGRYGLFGERLTEQDINLVCFDLPGHGEQCEPESLGQLPRWEDAFEAILAMHQQLQRWDPNVPLFIMGHSFGGYLVADLLNRQPRLACAGAIISGAGINALGELKAGLLTAKFECWRTGDEGKSKLLNRLSFQKFNRAFKPNTTEFDWLSRDPAQVMAYIEDPWCGFAVSNRFWVHLAQANIRMAQPGGLSQYPAHLPTLLVGGAQDPVSRQGLGLRLLGQALAKGRMENLTVKTYQDGRHEMLFELTADTVMADLAHWIISQCQPDPVPLADAQALQS